MVSRREFLNRAAIGLGTAMLWPGRAWAGLRSAASSFPRVDISRNLFLAFNAIREAEGGESDEFTSLANIDRVLKAMKVPAGATIIGIGARTGKPGDVYAMPGEMGYLRTYGGAFQTVVTSPVDARPLPLGVNDPIVVTQLAVLHPDTGHVFEVGGADQAGSVLWTMYRDETVQSFLGQESGLHDAFSDTDGGRLETIYRYSAAAHTDPGSIDWTKARAELTPFFPSFKDAGVWRNFRATLGNPLVERDWRAYVRAQGWRGAAVVLQGSMRDITQFHLKQWNRTSPAQDSFEIGAGTHGIANLRYGREARIFGDPAAAPWTMVGFIWDLENHDNSLDMTEVMRFSDLFGQDFHFHGFRDDGKHGGHTLMALASAEPLKVTLYPLDFVEGRTAFLFNNDLEIVKTSLRQSAAGLEAVIRNNGENFARDVRVDLTVKGVFGGGAGAHDALVIKLLNPREELKVTFTGEAGQSRSSERELLIDRDGNFLEGGQGTANNRLLFGPL